MWRLTEEPPATPRGLYRINADGSKAWQRPLVVLDASAGTQAALATPRLVAAGLPVPHAPMSVAVAVPAPTATATPAPVANPEPSPPLAYDPNKQEDMDAALEAFLAD